MAPRNSSTPDEDGPKAPGVKVVEALASPGSAGFMADVLADAAAAYRREQEGLVVPAPEDTAQRPLTAVQRGALRLLDAHAAQIVNAVTVPDGGGS